MPADTARSLTPALEEAARYSVNNVEIPRGAVLAQDLKGPAAFVQHFDGRNGIEADVVMPYLLNGTLASSEDFGEAVKAVKFILSAVLKDNTDGFTEGELTTITEHGKRTLSVLKSAVAAALAAESSISKPSRRVGSGIKRKSTRKRPSSAASAETVLDATDGHTPVSGLARDHKKRRALPALTEVAKQSNEDLTVGLSGAGRQSPSAAAPSAAPAPFAEVVRGSDNGFTTAVITSLMEQIAGVGRDVKESKFTSEAKLDSLADGMETVKTNQRELKKRVKAMEKAGSTLQEDLAELRARVDRTEVLAAKPTKSAARRLADVSRDKMRRAPAADTSSDESEQAEDSEVEEGELTTASHPRSGQSTPSHFHIPPANAAHTSALLGRAKLDFPKYIPKDGLDLFFSQAQRYFRLCGTDPSVWVEYAVMSLSIYAEWWEKHLLTAPLHCATDWEHFKTTIHRFAVVGDPRANALSKLLDIRQGSWSLPLYCQNFMRLVHDSKTSPDESWLIPRFLKGLNDQALRRAAASNNGVEWKSITDLLQHVTTLTAFDHSNINDAKPRDHPAAGKQKFNQNKKDYKKAKASFNGNGKRESASANAFKAGSSRAATKSQKKPRADKPTDAEGTSFSKQEWQLMKGLLAKAKADK
jgi:Retrotransposon gag protein